MLQTTSGACIANGFWMLSPCIPCVQLVYFVAAWLCTLIHELLSLDCVHDLFLIRLVFPESSPTQNSAKKNRQSRYCLPATVINIFTPPYSSMSIKLVSNLAFRILRHPQPPILTRKRRRSVAQRRRRLLLQMIPTAAMTNLLLSATFLYEIFRTVLYFMLASSFRPHTETGDSRSHYGKPACRPDHLHHPRGKPIN